MPDANPPAPAESPAAQQVALGPLSQIAHLSSVGASGIVVWLLWYVFTSILPALESRRAADLAAYMKESESQRELFSRALADQRAHDEQRSDRILQVLERKLSLKPVQEP